MKKLLVILVALVAVVPAFAQYYPDGRPIPPRLRNGYNAQRTDNRYYHNVYYGLRLGFGVSTVNSDAESLNSNKSKTGINVGAVVGVQLTPTAPLYFETGLYYNEKGGKSENSNGKFTYNLGYLEVPLLVKYKYYANRDFSIEPFAGGYLACGVSGKIKDYNNRAAYSSFSSNEDAFNRFDGGIRVGCGLGWQNLYMEASYDIGLANIGKDSFDDTHNGCFNLTFGVNF
ncbi:MAG: porin family protein [Prevotellaceae bacterium]|nr:porin family protein [Prevotellaceae bacterium]